ncbi:MAG: zinc-dependent alcohol dehydrogenase family protein [Myxococcota bacterium]
MKAMQFWKVGEPLREVDLPLPRPGTGQVRLRVLACAVCRTDLHLVDGELPDPVIPVIPGHQVVGVVEALGEGATRHRLGELVGVPWLGWSCGACRYCWRQEENLCDRARFTGCHLDGGYAEHAVADERFCIPLPASLPHEQLAPLLCAGLIGFRAYRMVGDVETLGFYGFGSAAHLLAQLARAQGRRVLAFTRPGDTTAQQLALSLGAVWAGSSDEKPPEELDGAIIFAAAGELVPTALRAVRKGGTVVCAGIHMSDIPSFPYAILWGERCVRSVANLTRDDGERFFQQIARTPVHAEVQTYPLAAANQALADLRAGKVRGTAVLQVVR